MSDNINHEILHNSYLTSSRVNSDSVKYPVEVNPIGSTP